MQAPPVETERRAGKKRRAQGAARPVLRRWRRRLLAVLVIVILIPVCLTPIYRLPFIHPVSTLMLADLAALRGYDRRWIPLEEMGGAVVQSVMMSEDGQFCSHYGIDLRELRAVVDETLSGERPRGASTIPMQTVKNLFLWPGRSFLRKGLEAPLAIYFDAVVPKRRVMEIYLNIAEWGPGIYGVEAAAQHYFGRPAKNLSARQAALLAVTLPDPLGRNPAKPSAGLNRLASLIEGRARRSGAYIQCLQ